MASSASDRHSSWSWLNPERRLWPNLRAHFHLLCFLDSDSFRLLFGSSFYFSGLYCPTLIPEVPPKSFPSWSLTSRLHNTHVINTPRFSRTAQEAAGNKHHPLEVLPACQCYCPLRWPQSLRFEPLLPLLSKVEPQLVSLSHLGI